MVAAALLASPFLLDYDLVLLAIPLAWIARRSLAGGFLPWEKSILFLVWFFPMFARILSLFASLTLMPLVLALLMFDIIRRAAIWSPPVSVSHD